MPGPQHAKCPGSGGPIAKPSASPGRICRIRQKAISAPSPSAHLAGNNQRKTAASRTLTRPRMLRFLSMLVSHQERPRELKWYHAGPMLYGDWGTSRFYVLGLAFYFALFESFWYILGVGMLVAA